MNVLFILGNGFDINLGLKTGYQDFYEYYCMDVEDESQQISDFKKSIIDSRYDFWSDLEIGLGQNTNNYLSVDDFDEVTDSILSSLSSYLEKIQSDFSNFDINIEKFLDDLSYPEKYLKLTHKEKLEEFKKVFPQHVWNIDIVTFNYTNVVEQILKDNQSPVIGQHSDSRTKDGIKHVLRNIIHIHGHVDDGMILGVNDTSQISNSSFHDNLDIEESLIKHKHNEAKGENLDVRFSNIIDTVDLIVAFGLSFGDTDRIWWEKIGARLENNNTRLIIFGVGNNINRVQKVKVERDVRKIKDNFLSQTGLSKDIQESIANRIYVAVNTKMFQGFTSKPKDTKFADKFGNAKIELANA